MCGGGGGGEVTRLDVKSVKTQLEVSLITTSDTMTPNYDPIFTSPTHYTDPSIQVM